jgi:hypothetical protein
VHLAYYTNADNGGAAGMIHHRMTCDGVTWNADAAITSPTADGDVDNEEPRLAQERGSNKIFAVWRSTLHGNPQGGWPPYSIQMKQLNFTSCAAAATATYPSRRLGGGIPLSYASVYRPEMYGDPTGMVHTAWWDETTGANVVYRRGALGSAMLGPVSQVSVFTVDHPEPGGITSTPALATGGFQSPPGFVSNGTTAFIAYQQNASAAASGLERGPVFLRESANNGTTWGAEQAISTSGLGTTPRLAIDNINNQNVGVVWADTRSGTSTVYYRLYTLGALSGGSSFALSPSPQDFGSVMTSASGAPIALTLVNSGTAGTISSITASGPDFHISSTTCGGALGAGASCTVNVVFSPTALGARTGAITAVTDDANGPAVANLTGNGAVSSSFNSNVNAIVTGYYETILGREPDSGGLTFWSGEATRVNGLGADVREAFYALSMTFFSSTEYTNKNTSDSQYVTDLYRTFFLRSPDGPGLAFWTNQMAGGMDRESVLNNFLFSTEFVNFMTGVFGTPSIRPEINMTMDLFRGAFGRLPDSGGFNFWLGQIRTAQCQGGAAVNTAMDNISATFLFSPEYGTRDSSRAPALRNPMYVSDLYNLFLRRGGDLSGYNFWVGQVNGPQTRDQVRLAFLGSTEFQNRVGAVIAAGCFTGP